MEVCRTRKNWKALIGLGALVLASCGRNSDGSTGTAVADAAYRTKSGAVNIYAEDGADNLAPAAARAVPMVYVPNSRSGSVTVIDPKTYHAVVHDLALSAADAGFRNIFIMGDHGDGQDVLGAVAKELDAQWRPRGVRVFYVPDPYFKAKQQARAYESSHGITTHDVHAGTDDTSELMAIDAQHRWIRGDKLAPSTGRQTAVTGVDGDPTKASVRLGNIFLQYKIDDAVAQIRQQLANR